MTVGIDVALIAKALTPVIGEVCKSAGSSLSDAFGKWKAEGFAERLAHKLSSADKVKTIWSRSEEVSLSAIYYPSSIKVPGAAHKVVHSTADLPTGNIVIEGIVGHGKSMFLQYLYLQELAGRGSGVLPLFILLRTLTEKKGLHSHICDGLDRLELSKTKDVFEHLAKSGKIILLLDGFDEIEEDLVPTVVQELEELADKYPALTMIVTSRPSNDIQRSRHFGVVHLNGIGRYDYSGFLSKLGLEQAWAEEIVHAIVQSPAKVVSLITTPLMLTLVVLVYEAEKEVPRELPDFFERLFLTMFSHHDRLKAGFRRKHNSGLSERQLQLLFEAFCFASMKQKHGRSLSAEQFASSFEIAVESVSGEKCKVEDFRKDITKVSCLMLEEGLDLTTFLHFSICEYFAASFIKRSSDAFAQKFYRYVIYGNSGWEVVMSFLEKIDSYRFAKYYTVPSGNAFLGRLNSTEVKDADDDDWFDFLDKELIGFVIDYGDKSGADKEFSPVSFGPYSTTGDWGDEIISNFVNCITEASKETLPEGLTEAEILERTDLFYLNSHTRRREYSMNLKVAMNEFGSKNFLIQFGIFERRTRQKVQAALEIIKTEEGKASMFDF